MAVEIIKIEVGNQIPRRKCVQWKIETIDYKTYAVAYIGDLVELEKKFPKWSREAKLKQLLTAIHGLEGVKIPYNIIKHQLEPLQKWLDAEDKKEKKISYRCDAHVEAVFVGNTQEEARKHILDQHISEE